MFSPLHVHTVAYRCWYFVSPSYVGTVLGIHRYSFGNYGVVVVAAAAAAVAAAASVVVVISFIITVNYSSNKRLSPSRTV
jgi:hypothetical protein